MVMSSIGTVNRDYCFIYFLNYFGLRYKVVTHQTSFASEAQQITLSEDRLRNVNIVVEIFSTHEHDEVSSSSVVIAVVTSSHSHSIIVCLTASLHYYDQRYHSNVCVISFPYQCISCRPIFSFLICSCTLSCIRDRTDLHNLCKIVNNDCEADNNVYTVERAKDLVVYFSHFLMISISCLEVRVHIIACSYTVLNSL